MLSSLSKRLARPSFSVPAPSSSGILSRKRIPVPWTSTRLMVTHRRATRNSTSNNYNNNIDRLQNINNNSKYINGFMSSGKYALASRVFAPPATRSLSSSSSVCSASSSSSPLLRLALRSSSSSHFYSSLSSHRSSSLTSSLSSLSSSSLCGTLNHSLITVPSRGFAAQVRTRGRSHMLKKKKKYKLKTHAGAKKRFIWLRGGKGKIKRFQATSTGHKRYTKSTKRKRRLKKAAFFKGGQAWKIKKLLSPHY